MDNESGNGSFRSSVRTPFLVVQQTADRAGCSGGVSIKFAPALEVHVMTLRTSFHGPQLIHATTFVQFSAGGSRGSTRVENQPP